MGIISTSLKNTLVQTGRKLNHIYLVLTQTELCKLGMLIFLFRALNFGVALCGFHVYPIQAAAEKHL